MSDINSDGEPSLETLLAPSGRVPAWQRSRGRIAIRIDAQGRWYFRGSQIQRESMVRLFASLLRREDSGAYVLDAPEQILQIVVDDAPLVATDVDVSEDQSTLLFTLNTGIVVAADAMHPLLMREATDAPERRCYLRLDGDIEAVIHRNVYYRLVERAETDADGRTGVFSAGHFFTLD